MAKQDDLREEYKILQGHYEGYDQKAIALKSLATPLLGTGLAFGVKEGQPSIILVTIAIACCLWLLEAVWKDFQYAFVPRIETIEDWFAVESSPNIPAFQIYRAWGARYGSWTERLSSLCHNLALPFVALPYVLIICAGGFLLWHIGATTGEFWGRPAVERKLGAAILANNCPEARKVALSLGDVSLAEKARSLCDQAR